MTTLAVWIPQVTSPQLHLPLHHSQGHTAAKAVPRATLPAAPGLAQPGHNPTAGQPDCLSTSAALEVRGARTTTQQPALSCSITRAFRYASFSHFHSSKWLPAEWGEDELTTC